MKLIELHLENFRAHADSTIRFPATGVIGVLGSNESGKSTVLEAIGWALYGSDATRGTMAGIRWKGAAGKRIATVTLDFEVGGLRYTIARDERDASLIHHPPLSPAGIVLARGTSAVNAAIPTLLGMSWREFSSTYLASQKDLARLASMKPTERQTFMREVMGIGRIDEALARCRERKNAIAREAAGLREGLGDREPLEQAKASAEAEHGFADAALEAETAKLEEFNALLRGEETELLASAERKTRHQSLDYQHKEAERVREYSAGEVEKLDGEIEAAEAARARILEAEPELGQMPALQTEREEMRRGAEQARERTRLVGRLNDITQKRADSRSALGAAERRGAMYAKGTVEALVEQYRAADRDLQARRTERVGRLRALQASADSARDGVDRLRDRHQSLASLGAEGHCPTCRRVMGEQLDTVLSGIEQEAMAAKVREKKLLEEADEAGVVPDTELELEARLEDLRSRGEEARTAQQAAAVARAEASALRSDIEEAEQEGGRIDTRLAELDVPAPDPARRQAVDARIAELEALDRSLAPQRELVGSLRTFQDQRARHTDRARDAAETAGRCRTAIAELAWDADAHASLAAATVLTREGRDAAATARAAAQASMEAAAAARERATRALAEYDGRAVRLTAMLDDLRVHERAADRLDAFRVITAGELRPELEELASGFVSLLTDGRHEAVTLSEDFAVTLHEAGVPLEVVSGGTEDVTAIALRLAVSQMIAERAGHPLSLLILDEPFGSLDDVRQGNVLDLLRRLSRTFEQIVVISHIKDTREMVDHVIEVEYDEARGVSRIRQSASADEPLAPAEAA